jgi:hypothetical protein
MSLATQINNAVLKQFQNFQGVVQAEIAAYYSDSTADIDFLKTAETFDADGAKKILNYPKAYKVPCMGIGGVGKAPYKKGDIVFVAFAVSELSKSGKRTSDLSAFFNKGNCVVLGKFLNSATDTEISWTIGTTTLALKADGLYLTVGGVTINLFTHLHGTPVGPTTPPTPGT